MRAYRYRAYDDAGRRKSGTVIAETEADAARRLKERGYFADEITARPDRRLRAGRRGRLSTDQQSVFIRQMAVLLAADLPVDDALDAVQTAGSGAAMDGVAARAKAALMDGAPLSQALDASGAGFAPYVTAAIRAGETSGDLAPVFESVAAHLESTGADRARLVTAMIYPGFVAAVALLVCGVLMTTVAPQIVAMFEGSDRPLPELTRIVLTISDFVFGNWKWLLGGAAAFAAAFPLALRLPRLHRRWQGLVLALPVAGRLARMDEAAAFLRTLALVTASRQTTLDAIANAGEVLRYHRFRAEAARMGEALRSGAALSDVLKGSDFLPPVALQLVTAGEKSARLAPMLDRAAAMVEGWASNERKRIAALLDPALMILVGAFVLTIVLAVLLPIFDLQAVVAG